MCVGDTGQTCFNFLTIPQIPEIGLRVAILLAFRYRREARWRARWGLYGWWPCRFMSSDEGGRPRHLLALGPGSWGVNTGNTVQNMHLDSCSWMEIHPEHEPFGMVRDLWPCQVLSPGPLAELYWTATGEFVRRLSRLQLLCWPL